VYWWFDPVWRSKSVASAKETSSLTYVSVSYWLVCHDGVNWKGETLTVNHSLSPFPIVPHATALSYSVFVVLSILVVLHWPRFPIIRKKNDLVFIIHLCFRVHLSNNMKNRWSDLLTHWLMTHDSLTHLTHKTCVLHVRPIWKVIKQTKLYFRVKINVKKESESRHGTFQNKCE